MRLRFAGGLALLLVLVPSTVPAQPAVVDGQVRDARGAPVPYANVRLAGTTDGAATDETGRFRFTTQRTGPVVLRASAVGYEPTERSIRLGAGDTTTVQVTLPATSVQLDEAVVTGETYSTGSASKATLGSTEAVTTPGAQGDLFRALQSFPGVASPGDGAGLFVRGGDVTETKLFLREPMATFFTVAFPLLLLFAFGVPLPEHPLLLFGALLLAGLSLLAVGFLLGAVVPTVRAAQAVGNALFFPMLFLSGAAIPQFLFPEWLKTASLALPL
ncbi:MAG: hypothetical protein BRD30_11735, partial [Bacteroidetes bacterium QH_2_63_10]